MAATPLGSALAVASGNEVWVTLTGVADNTRAVNASDVSGVKAHSGQPTSALNFKFDVNVPGTISSSDVSAVKARSGVTLP